MTDDLWREAITLVKRTFSAIAASTPKLSPRTFRTSRASSRHLCARDGDKEAVAIPDKALRAFTHGKPVVRSSHLQTDGLAAIGVSDHAAAYGAFR
jgi:hypothetical protein